MGTTSTPQPSSWLTIPERMGDEADVLRYVLDQFACALRVSMPGVIQSFNAAKQTAVIQLSITENMIKNVPDGYGNVVPTPKAVAIPVLSDVPVAFQGGGGFTATFPYQAGDECVVIFSDLCINAWWANGGTQNQEVKRRHDLSDGICFIGVRSQPRALASYSTNAAQLRSDDGTTSVTVAPGQITLKATNVVIEGELAVTGDAQINTGTTPLDLGIHVHTGGTLAGGLTGPPET